MVYIQTSKPGYQVRVGRCGGDGDYQGAYILSGEIYAEVVPAVCARHEFNLVQNLRGANLQLARDAAKRAGLRLRHPETMAVR